MILVEYGPFKDHMIETKSSGEFFFLLFWSVQRIRSDLFCNLLCFSKYAHPVVEQHMWIVEDVDHVVGGPVEKEDLYFWQDVLRIFT